MTVLNWGSVNPNGRYSISGKFFTLSITLVEVWWVFPGTHLLSRLRKALTQREFGVCLLHGFPVSYKLGEELGIKDLRSPTL